MKKTKPNCKFEVYLWVLCLWMAMLAIFTMMFDRYDRTSDLKPRLIEVPNNTFIE